MINNSETLSVETHNKISNLLFEFVEHNNKTNQSYPLCCFPNNWKIFIVY